MTALEAQRLTVSAVRAQDNAQASTIYLRVYGPGAGGVREIQPPFMLTSAWPIVRAFVEHFLSVGFSLRADLRDPPEKAFHWPKEIGTTGALNDLAATIAGSFPDAIHSRYYPLMLWLIPQVEAWEIGTTIQAFIDNPDDLDLWHQILRLGAVRISIFETSSTISGTLASFDEAMRGIEEALRFSVIPFSWV